MSARDRLIDAANEAVFTTTGKHMDDPPGGWVCLAAAERHLDRIAAGPPGEPVR